ncbi:MAG TPA: translation elongation factor 4 [Candidatus Aminicenantes bacterium]|nr:translation elongation factor 4 [Candidatus Aminicenantes bacterium]HRY63973.1 translation elongation factor 4 [Candidatus Aminicenantes bacterium]HRZ70886.1 translation elongation factor 4 [Candidatus Aminicenantes bacterium]
MKNIRNFSIIAHVDHGKSTLADRFIELTGALSARELKEQVLDTMDLERERGITIKAQTVRLNYKSRSGEDYVFDLIDTPGHVDFSYEVSRSLAACDGALLVIDASQGVEAQTLANTYLAVHNDLVLVPVINKIDLPQIQIEDSLEQMEHLLGLPRSEALLVSAKTGQGLAELFEAVVERIPPPQGDPEAPLKALLFDSWFDVYRGAVVLVRVIDGQLRTGDRIVLMASGAEYEAEEIGTLTPKPVKADVLKTGEVGYLVAGIKKLSDARVGDTITHRDRRTAKALPGFKEAKPMVFCGIFPAGESNIEELRDAMEKLRLNDASFQFVPENSPALGLGFRAGFLGLLHREIVQERLERDYGLTLITTAPSVGYRVTDRRGETVEIHNPSEMPEPTEVAAIEEPIIEAVILTPDRYLGNLFKLLEERRGVQKKMEYIGPGRVLLTYLLPLNEVVFDFYNQIKQLSQGYASLDYEFAGYREGPLVKLDILINGDPVDALSLIVHEDKAVTIGRGLVERMRKVIPRQQYEVALQAAIGKRIIARETVKPFRKDVLAKLYGGDYTRKMKVLEKQKTGKKRMRRVGKVDIPQEAFLAILEVK